MIHLVELPLKSVGLEILGLYESEMLSNLGENTSKVNEKALMQTYIVFCGHMDDPEWMLDTIVNDTWPYRDYLINRCSE